MAKRQVDRQTARRRKERTQNATVIVVIIFLPGMVIFVGVAIVVPLIAAIQASETVAWIRLACWYIILAVFGLAVWFIDAGDGA